MLKCQLSEVVLNKLKIHFYILQLIAAPVMASLAVGIGVPILLFYVYGVVPVSLCRSGGCGVTTSSNGVHFDFDEEHSAPKTVNIDYFTTPGKLKLDINIF